MMPVIADSDSEAKYRVTYLCLQVTHQGQASYAHVNEIIQGLRKRQWHVDLVEPSYNSHTVLPGGLERALPFLRAQIRLWRKHKDSDILYVRSHFATFPSVFLARQIGMPVVLEVNGSYDDIYVSWPWTRRLSPMFRWLVRTQLRLATAIIVVTPQLKSWAVDQGVKTTVYVIPNGANTELFRPQIDGCRPCPDPYVVFFGALSRWQGIPVLLEAVKSPCWPSGLKLVIVGDGAERAIVEKAVEKNPAVVYLGKRPYQDMPAIVGHSLAGLSPKSAPRGWKTFGLCPLKVFEILACGVPAVVSDWPGQVDLVREYGCGVVVPPDDPDALAAACARLYHSPVERSEMGRLGRNAIVKYHSWDQRAEDTSRVLKSVLDKCRGAQVCS